MKIFTTIFSIFLSILCVQTVLLAENISDAIGKTYTTVACNGFTYCESMGNFANSEWIESFHFNTIDNVSGINDGYADFTSFSTDVIPGDVYPVTCVMGLTASFTEFFRIWIDFNQNGLFEDEELVFDPGGSSETQTGTIAIPIDAVNGSTLLRVSMKYNAAPTACEPSFTFGEVEDYCVNIINPDFCYNPYVQISDIGETGAFLDWNEVQIAQGYNIRYREVGTADWIEIYTVEDSLSLTDLEDCGEYEFQIQSDCDTTMTDYSNSYVFETFGCGACIDYEYCASAGENTTFEYINLVSIADLNNQSGDNMGYADFGTDFTTDLNNDSTYLLTLKPTYGFFAFSVNWRAWIDYNQDGDFDEANELLFNSGTTTDTLIEVEVTIPSDAVIGLTKMRISMQEFGNQQQPCAEFFYGEVEDYCVTIRPDVLPCITPEHLDTSDVSSFSIKMLWEIDEYEIGVGYVIRYKPTLSTDWKEVSAVDPTYEAFDLDACTDYEYQVRTVCPQALSDYSESFFFTSACLSGIEETFVATDDIANVLVYPNPFKDQINMTIELQKAGDLNLQLFDINGKMLMYKSHENMAVGEHQFELNGNSQLASGMYFIRVATENSVITKKLVKQ